jgi:glycine C-acetyltransferase
VLNVVSVYLNISFGNWYWCSNYNSFINKNANNMETNDFSKSSLIDFLDFEDKDIFERAEVFSNFIDYLHDKRHHFYRRVSTTGSASIVCVSDKDTGIEREMIFMASNDYLNLTKHPRTIQAGVNAILKYGTGAGSVPLLGGTLDVHIELEEKIAKMKGCEAAIIYSSGFGSNCGSLLALLKEKDLAILDMYVHASIIDGCANTNVKYFKHNDLDSLEHVLKNNLNFRTKFVIVDGVYSMDGDIAPLDKIVELAHQYNAYVMVDEAHASGVIGATGKGTPEYFNIEGKVDIVAGTFSKGLGSVGGYICGSHKLINLLHYYSRSYMFSTAMTPQTAASLVAAIDVIQDEPALRAKLWDNINYFKSNLTHLGFEIGAAQTAIFPVIIGDDFKVRETCRILDEMGIYANPVQYPAVPRKLSRIRFSLMSSHTREHLDKTLNTMEHIKKVLKLTELSQKTNMN